jgi:hypothetical protein
MKNVINLHITILLLITSSLSFAQNSAPLSLAERIANRMQDSLILTTAQKERLYEVNLLIHIKKLQIRQRFVQRDSIRIYLQRVENTRDGLYERIINNEEKYKMYKVKKTHLISAY